MKKALLTAVICCCCIINALAQIPNPGLENWTHNTFPSYDNPNGWGTLNSETAIINITTVKKSTDVHGGTYAAKLETFYISFANETAPGIMTTGTFNTTTRDVEGGFVYAQRPTLLRGWYKYAPAANDTAVITCELWRWTGGVRETVAQATFTKTTTVSSYTQFNAMFSYSSSATPDSARIIVSSSSTSAPVAGSVLYVDDFSFVTIAPLTLTEDSANALCMGNCNGRAAVIPAGGQAPYTYLWSASAGSTTDSSKTALCAGTYTITVTDGIGQTATASFNITYATSLNPPTMSASNNCGIANGTATATPISGTGPYTYQWDANAGGQTTQTATNLTAGTYNATVTDNNGCSVSSSSTVGTTQLSRPDTASTAENCGQANGTATVTPTAGVAPYVYQWDANAANQTSQTATGLTAGTYGVTATDQNGCTATAIATVTSSGGLSATTGVTPVSCNGGNDGFATVTAIGGTTPYTYAWDANAASQTNDTATNLEAGSYNVTVSDAGGCTYVASANITQLSAITLSITSPAILCAGGTVNLTTTVSGGTNSYTYLWNDGTTTSSLTGRPAGAYCVTVTDNNGCQASLCDTLTQPAALNFAVTVTTIRCFGETGDIHIFASGGIGQYTYEWTNGETTDSLNEVAGQYSVTVTDGNGCAIDTLITLSQPYNLSFNFASGDVTTNGGNDGTASANVSGGTQPVALEWSNGATTDTLTGLTAGTYVVTATDASGCTLTDSVTIAEPVGIQNLSAGNVSIYPNPVDNELTVVLNTSTVQPAIISIYNALGALMHTEKGTGKMVINTSALASGVYMVEIQTGGQRVTKRLMK